MNALKLILIITLLFPATAHAYLDPGTGNALLAALLGLLGSALFFSKNLYYKMRAWFTGEKIERAGTQLAVFSEGSRYWPYFKDILDEFIKRGVHFTYYTMDMHDPAFELLDYGNENFDLEKFHIRYVGQGPRGYANISNLKEPYLLATTPNIGTPGYPVKKPPHCKNMMHIFHSVAGVCSYHKHSLDNYDTVILSGPAFADDIRSLEKKRNQAPKKLLVGGLPYVDDIVVRAQKLPQTTNGKTVLVASTWDVRGCLRTYGAPFIIDLAKAGYDVIVRPHPYSYVFEKEHISALEKALEPYPNVVMDDEIDNLASMARADILISDVSSIRMDYFYAFNRPIISLETTAETASEYEYDDLDSFWNLDISAKIGAYVKKEDISRIVEIVRAAGAMPLADGSDYVANIGSSAAVIAEQVIAMTTPSEPATVEPA